MGSVALHGHTGDNLAALSRPQSSRRNDKNGCYHTTQRRKRTELHRRGLSRQRSRRLVGA
jgi:hypothetical protein